MAPCLRSPIKLNPEEKLLGGSSTINLCQKHLSNVGTITREKSTRLHAQTPCRERYLLENVARKMKEYCELTRQEIMCDPDVKYMKYNINFKLISGNCLGAFCCDKIYPYLIITYRNAN